MDRSPDAGGRSRPGPWRHGFEIPVSVARVVPDLPGAVRWAAGGATVGFIALGGVGGPIGAGAGLLAHALRHR